MEEALGSILTFLGTAWGPIAAGGALLLFVSRLTYKRVFKDRVDRRSQTFELKGRSRTSKSRWIA